jgi:aminoglycoside phosphotransferase (APT) family kinase protein
VKDDRVRAIPTTIPHGRTAQRLTWPHLPRAVRALVEERCGSPVVEAASCDGGFTPGFASVLTCADGSRHFVKAASTRAQKWCADAYREEAVKLAALPPGVPAPQLLWVEDGDWVVLGIEYVEGRTPRRPWRQRDLDAALDTLEVVAEVLTPVPADLRLRTFADEFASWPAFWEHAAATRADLPHLDEAADLAARFASAAAGDSVVHTDVRDDNLILRRDGSVAVCDWNWPVSGAPWLDTLFLMIGPRGDGVDVDAVLASRSLTREVPDDHVDAMLALVIGYFFKSGDEPDVPTSRHLRTHQRWQGEVVWQWLCERRGWTR